MRVQEERSREKPGCRGTERERRKRAKRVEAEGERGEEEETERERAAAAGERGQTARTARLGVRATTESTFERRGSRVDATEKEALGGGRAAGEPSARRVEKVVEERERW